MATINPISEALRRIQHIKQHAINVVKNKEQLRNCFALREQLQQQATAGGSPSQTKKRKEKQEKKLQFNSEFIKLSNSGESK